MKPKKKTSLSSEASTNPPVVRVRLKRTTTESSYVDVKLTKDIVNAENCIDISSVFETALLLAPEDDAQWHFDFQETEIHPEQGDDDPFND